MGLRIGDEPVPNYRLVRFLGRGGFGQVWAATSPGGIHVALKIIDLSGREGVKEFKALRLMKSIRQANLTPILAFWLKDEDGQLVDESQVGNDLSSNVQPTNVQGTVLINSLSKMRPDELIIAMGLGDKTLSDRLRECSEQGLAGIPPDELFNYMIDAARAIDFLNTPRHDLGHGPISPIQHCDIKPQNILIVGDTAQVCDFGLARELGTNVKMTSAAVSPAYGAPELIEGRPPSGATDQYSLAITYVELRTGGLPFADPDSYLHVVNAHLYGGLDLNGLAAAEQDVIRKATSRDPADRFESALKMVKALRQACPDDGGSMRVMPTQSRQSTGAQVGSDLNVTMPLPSASTGNSTMPVPLMPQRSSGLTETPGVRVGVTKVDSRLQATTTHLDAEVESESQRAGGRRGRMWKTATAVAVLGVTLGAVYYKLYITGPVYQAENAALKDIDQGRDEKDLFARAGHYFDAYQNCEPFATNPRIAATVKKAEDFLKVTAEEVEKEVESVVGESSPDDSGRQRMLAGLTIYDQFLGAYLDAPGFRPLEEKRDSLRRSAAESFVSYGESLLRQANGDDATLRKARESFDKVDELISNKKDRLAFLAKLGLSRIEASRDELSGAGEALDGLRKELRARGTYEPLWQAQIRVLLALEAKKANDRDPKPMLEQLAELQDSDLALFNDPAIGGDEAKHVKSMLEWAAGFASLSKDDRDTIQRLAKTGSLQSLNEARDKLPAAQEEQDPGAQQKALQALRESAKRGIDSKDPATQVGFQELLYLADVLDPQSVDSDVSRAVEWFKATPTNQLSRLPQVTTALAKLATRMPAKLGLIVEALEAHASDPNAKHDLPLLYRQLVERLVNEPTEADNYFARLAAACERLRKLGGDDRLSNLALAESLHALHAKESSAEQRQRIRDLLSTAEQQTAVPALAMYEKFVKLLVAVDSKTMDDADRSQVTEIMRYATQKPPGFAFAVDARRRELALLAIDAAASLRAGADGTINVAAIADPYGDEGAAPKKAYDFLEGAKSIAPGIGEDARYQANRLLVVWHKGEMGRQIVTDKHQAELLKLVHDPAIKEHERLPLLYVRVHMPLKADDLANRVDAMDAMSTLFEALNRAPVEFDHERVLELAQQAEKWIDQAKDPLPTDKEMRKQLARLAYVSERSLARFKRHADETRRVERHKAYGLAVKLEGENPDYLAAHGFASLDFEPPLLKEAGEDVKELQRLAPDSAATQGLRAYVMLQEARHEPDSARKEKLAEEAVAAGEKAVKATTDRNELATYLLHLGDSYVAWANFGPKDDVVQAPRLNKAIQSVKDVRKIEELAYPEYANIILGNAYEDLAWLARVGGEDEINRNYDEAIRAFQEVVRSDSTLGLMNLGRCYYKREVDSRQTGHGYLDKAKTALAQALEERPSYAEAHRWLGGVHEAQNAFDLALKHYATAAQLAKSQHSYNFPFYIRYWARVALKALKSKEQAAPLRDQLVLLLKDSDLQAPDVHKELALRVAMTYEAEQKWPEATDSYTKEIGDNPTLLDAELLRGRALAWSERATAKVLKGEPAADEFRACALDWDKVVSLAGNSVTWFDLHQKAFANQLLWSASRGKGGFVSLAALKSSINAYDSALARIEQLPKGVPPERSQEAQKVFNEYVGLLGSDSLREDYRQLTVVERKLISEAEGRLGNAARKVSNQFHSKFMNKTLSKEFREKILSLK